MKPTTKVVVDNIRVLNALNNLNQNGLADRLGWDKNMLSKRMTGNIPFRVDELGEVAAALNTTPALLLTPGAGR